MSSNWFFSTSILNKRGASTMPMIWTLDTLCTIVWLDLMKRYRYRSIFSTCYAIVSIKGKIQLQVLCLVLINPCTTNVHKKPIETKRIAWDVQIEIKLRSLLYINICTAYSLMYIFTGLSDRSRCQEKGSSDHISNYMFNNFDLNCTTNCSSRLHRLTNDSYSIFMLLLLHCGNQM